MLEAESKLPSPEGEGHELEEGAKAKRYEAVLLYDSTESFFQSAKKASENLFAEHNLNIRDEVDLGVQQLSYPIKKKSEGHYLVYEFDASPSAIKLLSKELQTQEYLLRFLVVHLDKKAIAFRERRKHQKAQVKDEGAPQQ